MIPVYVTEAVEPAKDGKPAERVVCGECVKCGKCGKRSVCAVPNDRKDGTPARRKADAIEDVLVDLTERCTEELKVGRPPFLKPHHYDRFVPRGVRVFQVARDGRELAVTVQAVGKATIKRKVLMTIVGAVPVEAQVRVAPDAERDVPAASDFAIFLRKKMGYVNASLASIQAVAGSV